MCDGGGLLRVQKPKWAKSFKARFEAFHGHCCQGTCRGPPMIRLFRLKVSLQLRKQAVTGYAMLAKFPDYRDIAGKAEV